MDRMDEDLSQHAEFMRQHESKRRATKRLLLHAVRRQLERSPLYLLRASASQRCLETINMTQDIDLSDSIPDRDGFVELILAGCEAQIEGLSLEEMLELIDTRAIEYAEVLPNSLARSSGV
jgi:hypothetical protein